MLFPCELFVNAWPLAVCLMFSQELLLGWLSYMLDIHVIDFLLVYFQMGAYGHDNKQ